MIVETNSQKDLAKKAALKELWRRAQLSFKLDSTQKELYNEFYKSKHKISTWLLSRRNGKTYLLCVLALEQCIKKSGSIVKFVSPTKMQVETNVRPIFRQLLDDCPEDIKPEWRTRGNMYFFPNGSEIQLAGSDGGHAERLRGGDSDLFFVDEAGTCSDLDNLLKSILLPTTLITKGRGILASTPPKESEHDFLQYIEDAQLKGSLIKKTIDDNPRITQEQRAELIEELGGINSEDTRRELFCEIIKNARTSVLPEFDVTLEKRIVKEWPKPPFFDAYEAMDTGGKDFTVVLYGYFDFRAQKLVIEDETVIDFQEPGNTTKKLIEEVHKKELALWTNPITLEYRKPYKRVSDIDYIFLNEIRNQSAMIHKPDEIVAFDITKKDNRDAAISNTRIMLNSEKIIIHPRCKTLIRHLNNVKWNKAKTDFARSTDNGHYDAFMALVYLVRNVTFSKNPYPPGYEINLNGLFIRDREAFDTRVNTNTIDVFKRLFNIKPPRKY